MSDEDILNQRLKQLMSVSDRIRMDQMLNILDIDRRTFDLKLLDWAIEFGFKIDGDYIQLKQETMDSFIDMLDAQFEEWAEMESTQTAKPAGPSREVSRRKPRKKILESFAQAIRDDILERLDLQNRYQFLNLNLIALLNQEEYDFLKEVEKFCLRFEVDNNISHGPNEDIYDWTPKFGKKGYISRIFDFDIIDQRNTPFGLTAEFIKSIAIASFDPQFLMINNFTGLVIYNLYETHANVKTRLEALNELVTGKSCGCICLTEPERGSDAVHQQTICTPKKDGNYSLDGQKLYSVNAPKAKWAIVYASGETDEAKTLGQFLVNTSWKGWECERVDIPWVPKIHIGKESLRNLKVPKEYVLAGIGKGRQNLFSGLVFERIMKAIESLSQSWAAYSYAAIYLNIRKQFKKELMFYQGVAFPISDIWAKVNVLTYGLLKFCQKYDEISLKFGGRLPQNIRNALIASASQFKYFAANLNKEVCYECANLMGGIGFTSETFMYELVNISRIQEIMGGSKQIQLYVISMALRSLFKQL
jgi:alkylation response protein AidB-like acyl-CoA dehydrogenase